MKINKNLISKLLVFFVILQPFLDIYILFEDRVIEIFNFSPSTIIRFIYVGILLILTLFIIKYNKNKLWYVVYGIFIFSYIILHNMTANSFTSYMPGNFNYSTISELFYIVRLIISLAIIFISSNVKIPRHKLSKIVYILIFLISGSIVITNFFKISLGSYNHEFVNISFFEWFSPEIKNYTFYDTSTKGFFMYGNQISALLLFLNVFLLYYIIIDFKFRKIILLLIQLLAMVMLGTKVATLGFIISTIVMLIAYVFFTLIKRDIKFNYKIVLMLTAIATSWFVLYDFSPANTRDTITKEKIEQYNEKNKNIDNKKLIVFEESIKILGEEKKRAKVTSFVIKEYTNFNFPYDLVLDKYSFRYDPYFWYNAFHFPYVLRTDNRYMQEVILKRIKEINNSPYDDWFGISYTRMNNIFPLERDFISHYYTLGIVGLILFLSVDILILIASLFKMLFNFKEKFNFENSCYFIASVALIGSAYYSGNVMDALIVTIIFNFFLGQYIVNLFLNNKKLENNRIDILALHLNYGGVEQAITNLSNMLIDKYKVRIICTYKMTENPVFEINENVEIIYLLKDKPNKIQLMQSIKNKNIKNSFINIFKSCKILLLRKITMINYIKNSDAKTIVSSRIMFTKLLSKYGNRNAIKIAQEHRHHNNNRKYINSLKKACKNIDYLMPVSKELTDFYSFIINSKTKCIYIPHCINYIPTKLAKLKDKRIISIGRLSKEKGYIDLIEIFKSINNKYPDYKLDIVGDGNERENIQNKINQMNLNKVITMHGFQDKEYIHKLLEKSSIYVMTSFEESFGIVLLEAQSFGLPCLAFTSAQGATEIIKNNVNGYLIKNRDFKKMETKISDLINNYDLRIKLGKNGYKNSLQYSYEIIKKKQLSFFNKILKEK